MTCACGNHGLLQRLIEADGGSAVKHDVDAACEGLLVLFAQVHVRLCQVAVHCHDLLRKVWLFLSQLVEKLKQTFKLISSLRSDFTII